MHDRWKAQLNWPETRFILQWAIIQSSFCAASCIQVFKYLCARCVRITRLFSYGCESAGDFGGCIPFYVFSLAFWYPFVVIASLESVTTRKKKFILSVCNGFISCAFDRINGQTGQLVSLPKCNAVSCAPNKDSNSNEIKFTNAQKTMCECRAIFILFPLHFTRSFDVLSVVRTFFCIGIYIESSLILFKVEILWVSFVYILIFVHLNRFFCC